MRRFSITSLFELCDQCDFKIVQSFIIPYLKKNSRTLLDVDLGSSRAWQQTVLESLPDAYFPHLNSVEVCEIEEVALMGFYQEIIRVAPNLVKVRKNFFFS